MFVNYYKNISSDLKNYIFVKEKDFNNSPRNVRNFLINIAEIKKDEKNKKLTFENIPSEIKEYVEIDKDSFEDLDILCQQFIIKYVFKYKELLNKTIEDKKVDINILEKYNVSKTNYLENFLSNLNMLLRNEYYLSFIINIKENLKIKIDENNKCMKRLKVNIRNNKNKINNNTNKKDISVYENKIIHYEVELHKVSLIYMNYKNLYSIFNNIINISMINNN